MWLVLLIEGNTVRETLIVILAFLHIYMYKLNDRSLHFLIVKINYKATLQSFCENWTLCKAQCLS